MEQAEQRPQQQQHQFTMSEYQTSSEQSAAYAYPASYPSPPTHGEPNGLPQHSSSSMHGLGLLGCSMPGEESGMVGVMPPSPPSSEMWSRAAAPLQEHGGPAPTSQAPPDIFSAAYDPFASFQTPPQGAFVDARFTASPANVPDLTSSPGTSCDMSSSRSSFASYTASPPFAPQDIVHGLHSKVKGGSGSGSGEGAAAPEWLSGPNGEPVMSGPLVNQDFVSMSQSPFEPSSYDAAPAYASSADWSRMSSTPMDEEQSSQTSQTSEPRSRSRSSRAGSSTITNVARTRKRRQLTTAADANHECRICGKLFGRSYNFKAHMETHDPSRSYAHPCLIGKCGKKFVRKTDLTRHHQSVHMKQRNYQCELCGNLFARKDTLRRHTEDGCSKRFEISSKPGAAAISTPGSNSSSGGGGSTRFDSPASAASLPVNIKAAAAGFVPMRRHHLSYDSTRSSGSSSPHLSAANTSHPHPHAHAHSHAHHQQQPTPAGSSVASSSVSPPPPPGSEAAYAAAVAAQVGLPPLSQVGIGAGGPGQAYYW